MAIFEPIKLIRMKNISILLLALLVWQFAIAQNEPHQKSIATSWKNIDYTVISDNGEYSLTGYKGYSINNELIVRNNKENKTLRFKNTNRPQFFNNDNCVFFMIKDTLYLVNLKSFEAKQFFNITDPVSEKESPFIVGKSDGLIVINGNNGLIDTLLSSDRASITQFCFGSRGSIFVLAKSNNKSYPKRHSLLRASLKGRSDFIIDTLYSTTDWLWRFDIMDKSEDISLLTSSDSTNKGGVKGLYLEAYIEKRRERKYKEYPFDLSGEDPFNLMEINVKKGFTFGPERGTLFFETKKMESNKPKAKRGDTKEVDLELWRWSDTLLPTQKGGGASILASTLRWAYYPKERRVVQLSFGKGVYLDPSPESRYAFELDRSPYQFEENWRDPIPKDIYLIDKRGGGRKLLVEAFDGNFAPAQNAPFLFLYPFNKEIWFSIDLESGEWYSLSNKLPYPIADEDFDRPQPAGTYGQFGVTADGKYFLVNDKYDIWALPIRGDGNPIELTKGLGRKRNVRFRLVKGNTNEGSAVDLSAPFLLSYLNLDNYDSGFYLGSIRHEPKKLIEGSYKYSYSKLLPNGNHLIKQENFSEAPDYWIYSKDFSKGDRITQLNEQLENFKMGSAEVISWRDSLGFSYRGLLYKPYDYDSNKIYPTIVHIYETKTEGRHLFYTPEATVSEINPLMYVNSGYVIFMPDIAYTIGAPGASALKSVKSGVEYLIGAKISDPNLIGIQGHSWGGYQTAYILTQSNLFKCGCIETAVANMTSAYSGLRAGPGKSRMFMYESTQSRIGGTLWNKRDNFIFNSPLFYLDRVTAPILSRHCDGDEAVPFSQGLELFMGLKRLGKQIWMFNYRGEGHNLRKRECVLDWNLRMKEFFDFYLKDGEKPEWM